MRLSFVDSELASVQAAGDAVALRFSAAAVEPSAPGEERGYLLGLVLECRGARAQGDAGHAFGRVLDGALFEGAVRLRHLELPFERAGALQLVLTLAFGQELVVHAASIHAVPGSGTPFRASLTC